MSDNIKRRIKSNAFEIIENKRKVNKSFDYFKNKFTKLLKLFWTLFCIICFSYQTISLLNEYLLGSTIVKIRVGRFDRENIPSITICLPLYMSFEKGVKYNDKYKHWFHYDNTTLIEKF